MTLILLSIPFAVCKLRDPSLVRWDGEYAFLSKEEDQWSLVCESGCLPSNTVAVEDGWRALKVEGPLSFSLTGVLAKITAVLAQAGISVFTLSTYDTDYILIKAEKRHTAAEVLTAAGYEIIVQ